MEIRDIRLVGTTSAGGALTVTSTEYVKGFLYNVEWIDGDFSDGVDAVLSVTETPEGVDKTLLTLTDANNDDTYYPRDIVHDLAGGALTGTAGGDREKLLINGKLKLVVADGGATKEGGCIAYILEDE